MPMELQRVSAPIALKDKILAFYEEASLITGISVGSMIGAKIMMHDQAMGMHAPGPLLHGAYTAIAIGLTAGKILPIGINYLCNRNRLSKNIEAPLVQHLDKACTPHGHKTSRLAGLAAGVVMTASLASTFNLINVAEFPVVQKLMSAWEQPVVASAEPIPRDTIVMPSTISAFGGSAPVFLPAG